MTASCSGTRSSETQPPEDVEASTEALITDQARNGGAQGFFWLPPIVERKTQEGTFDGKLAPQVDIDEIDGRDQIKRHVATFTTTAGRGAERIKADRDSYDVTWDAKQSGAKVGQIFRIRVSVGGRQLGLADVKITQDGCSRREVDRKTFVPLVKGHALPIAFFLNRCAPVICEAADSCQQAGVCNPSTGKCSSQPKADGAACSDGNACTRSDTCKAGACVGADPVACAASDQCHDPGTCNPASGACSNPPSADGTSCADGNACTRNDSCQAGACVGADPVLCVAADQCHEPGTCNPADGICFSPAKADGAACSDGDACTQSDTCQAGVCAGADPVVCAAAGCAYPGTCDSASGVCSAPSGCGPGCGNGRVERDPATAIEIAYLAHRCSTSANVTFAINGQTVLQGAARFTCDCEPGIRTAQLTSASVLGLLRSGRNTFSVTFPDGLAWATARVVGQQGTQEVVIFDADGGGDAEARNPDMCAAGYEALGFEAGTPIRTVEAQLGEECDDGNTTTGDGCSDVCLTE